MSVYTELAKLRSHEALLMGDFTTYVMNATFVLTRVKKVSYFFDSQINVGVTGEYTQKSDCDTL